MPNQETEGSDVGSWARDEDQQRDYDGNPEAKALLHQAADSKTVKRTDRRRRDA